MPHPNIDKIDILASLIKHEMQSITDALIVDAPQIAIALTERIHVDLQQLKSYITDI